MRRVFPFPGLLFCVLCALVLVGCSSSTTGAPSVDPSVQTVETAASTSGGQIYLYGESHANTLHQQKELQLWQSYYADGMRHLFVEAPSYTAEYLNLWMKAPDDTILEELYRDWTGTLSHSQSTLDFYRAIKQTCPETIFHGTDVGHQYQTTGSRYLALLRDKGQEDSDLYRQTMQTIEQGETYYQSQDDIYREKQMVNNFMQAFDNLDGESVMGIYGAYHVNPPEQGPTPNMAAQLSDRYRNTLHATDLAQLCAEEPVLQELTICGKTYSVSYWGKESIALPDYVTREFWRLEEGAEDFADCPTWDNVLPYNNYPVEVQTGQVFVMDLTGTDGTVTRSLYRADDRLWNGMLCSVQLQVEDPLA